ncbi:MAG: patatin-like phospholipase family protein [Blastocatellia bacterium]
MAANIGNRTGGRPRIGLALGGGVARGIAHVGVLRELERNNIPIDLIAGTSVGSLVGGGYAAGLSPDDLEKAALKIRWSDIGRVTVSRLGFFNSARMEDFIHNLFPIHEIEKMKLPFGAVATDIQEGRMVVFTEGDAALAIRASCAIPCYFIPVVVNGRMMVDGGLTGHLPAAVVRSMGADIVIAVDVHSQGIPIPPPNNIFTLMYQSLSVMGRSSVGYLYNDADVIVRPKVGHVRPDDLTRAAEMIAAGEQAVRESIDQIRQKLIPERKGFFSRWFAKPEGAVRKRVKSAG